MKPTMLGAAPWAATTAAMGSGGDVRSRPSLPSPDQRLWRARLCLRLHALALLLATVWTLLGGRGGLSDHDGTVLASWVFVLLLGWAIASWWWSTGRWFDPYPLFFIAVAVYHGGRSITLVLGYGDGKLLALVPDHWALRALVLVLFCLACLHLGALLSAATERTESRSRWSLPGSTKQVGLAIVAITLLPTLYAQYKLLGAAAELGYGGAMTLEAGGGRLNALLFRLADYMPIGLLLTIAGCEGDRRQARWFILPVVLYILAWLAYGARGPATFTATSLLWLWHTLYRRLSPVLVFLVSVPLALLLFVLISVGRGQGLGISIDAYTIQAAISDWQTVGNLAFNEMGITLEVTAYTMQLWPSERPYLRGMSYVYSLTLLFPNLFWSVHPAKEHAFFSPIIGDRYRPFFMGTHLAFGIVAEAYLNFGWLAPMLFLPLGLGVARLGYWAFRSAEPANYALTAALLLALLPWGRQGMFNIIRQIVWMGVLPYLAIGGFDRLRRGLRDRPPDTLFTRPTAHRPGSA